MGNRPQSIYWFIFCLRLAQRKKTVNIMMSNFSKNHRLDEITLEFTIDPAQLAKHKPAHEGRDFLVIRRISGRNIRLSRRLIGSPTVFIISRIGFHFRCIFYHVKTHNEKSAQNEHSKSGGSGLAITHFASDLLDGTAVDRRGRAMPESTCAPMRQGRDKRDNFQTKCTDAFPVNKQQ